MTDNELLKEAEEACQNSYSPYSHFRVGAAILTKTGKIYRGCNIENSSYGATVCAERTALFNAVSNGEKEIEKIAIFSPDSDNCPPCGICRQVLLEFAPDIKVIYRSKGKGMTSKTLSELLPEAFT